MSLERLDIRTELSRTAAPVRMAHEIYVSHLYPAGHGYPCANPRPLGQPIEIGDIGVLDGDRLDVLENLFALPSSFSSVPTPTIVHEPGVFAEGDCVTGGVDSCDVRTQEDEMYVFPVGSSGQRLMR